MTPRLTRRGFLAAATLIAAGCGSGSDDSGITNSSAEADADAVSFLVPLFADSQGALVPGLEQRTIWAIADFEGIPLEDPPERVSITITGEADAVGETQTVAAHGDGVPTAYYPLRFTPAAAGVYTASVDYNGQTLTRDFIVSERDSVALVQPGEAAIPVVTPTASDPRDVDPICTRNPECGLHGLTLSDALEGATPVALLVSTPAFCQTTICGPTLENLLGVVSAFPSVTFIHAEVYKNAQEVGPLDAEVADVISAYGLSFEPSLTLVGADGLVTERLDFAWDVAEMTDALNRLVS